MFKMHPIRATSVTMPKLMTAIQKIDMTKEEATTYHLRFSEQLGMVQVNNTTNGKESTNRIHLRINFIQPSLPSSRANFGSGGVDRIAGRHGTSTNTASSIVVVVLFASSLTLLPSSLMVGGAPSWCSSAGSMWGRKV